MRMVLGVGGDEAIGGFGVQSTLWDSVYGISGRRNFWDGNCLAGNEKKRVICGEVAFPDFSTKIRFDDSKGDIWL